MPTFQEQLVQCKEAIQVVSNKINTTNMLSMQFNYTELYNAVYALLPLIPNEYNIYAKRLRDVILPNLKCKDIPQPTPYGRPIMIPQNGINPYSFGELIATISYLDEIQHCDRNYSIWANIHPQIIAVSKTRFDSKHYADAVEAALKEINSRVKAIYQARTGEEKDGSALMYAAFSKTNPVIRLGDITTETGVNIQQGYMEMFAGAMIGIRNPQAHNNLHLPQADAIRQLYFASMLMYKIDNELI